MNTKPDNLVSQLAAIHSENAEWDGSILALAEAYKTLHENIKRHAVAGQNLIQRAKRGMPVNQEVAEITEVFRAHDPLFRSLSTQCLRCAEISRKMHAQFEKIH